jgi:NAD(P)H dehydrogenase (quinone)
MVPLPPVAVYGANHLSEADYRSAAAGLRSRLLAAQTARPIPYRPQNGGDYDDRMVLLPHVAAGRTGLDAHLA